MNWNEKSDLQKVLFIFSIIFAFAALVLSVLNLFGILTHMKAVQTMCWCLWALFQGILSWNPQNKIAILFFVASGMFFLSSMVHLMDYLFL